MLQFQISLLNKRPLVSGCWGDIRNKSSQGMFFLDAFVNLCLDRCAQVLCGHLLPAESASAFMSGCVVPDIVAPVVFSLLKMIVKAGSSPLPSRGRNVLPLRLPESQPAPPSPASARVSGCLLSPTFCETRAEYFPSQERVLLENFRE